MQKMSIFEVVVSLFVVRLKNFFVVEVILV